MAVFFHVGINFAPQLKLQSVSLDHGLQKIRWIGSSTVLGTGSLAPISFVPGTVGNTRMMVDGSALELCYGTSQALIPACHMVNGQSIVQRPSGPVTYFHLMFDQHELIWAEDALSESFYPGKQGIGALSRDAQQEIHAIFPELSTSSPWEKYGPLARSQIPKTVWHAIQ